MRGAFDEDVFGVDGGKVKSRTPIRRRFAGRGLYADSAAQQDSHMGEGCAVILEKFIPQGMLACTIMQEGAACQND